MKENAVKRLVPSKSILLVHILHGWTLGPDGEPTSRPEMADSGAGRGIGTAALSTCSANLSSPLRRRGTESVQPSELSSLYRLLYWQSELEIQEIRSTVYGTKQYKTKLNNGFVFITLEKIDSELERRNGDCRNDLVRANRDRLDGGTSCCGDRQRCPSHSRRSRRNRNRWSAYRSRCANRRRGATDVARDADDVLRADLVDPVLPSWPRPTGRLGFHFRTKMPRNYRVLPFLHFHMTKFSRNFKRN